MGTSGEEEKETNGITKKLTELALAVAVKIVDVLDILQEKIIDNAQHAKRRRANRGAR